MYVFQMACFNSRGSLVEVGVFDGEDVNGSFITGDAQEGRVVAKADAEINNVSKLKTVVAAAEADAEVNKCRIYQNLNI